MNQRFAGSPQGRQVSLAQPPSLPNQQPNAALLDLYNSRDGFQQEPAGGSFFRQANAPAGGGAPGAGGPVGDQNQFLYSDTLYSDALNRIMPMAASATGGLGNAGASTAGHPFQGVHFPDRSSAAAMPSFYGGMGSTSLPLSNMPGSSTGTGAGAAATSNNLDSLAAAMMRENAIMRERLMAQGEYQLASSLPYGSLLGGAGTQSMGRLNDRLVTPSQSMMMSNSSSLLGRNRLLGEPSGLQSGSLFAGQPGVVDAGKFPSRLPCVLAVPEDNQKLSNHQVFLRNQIEAFQATEDDLTTHTRGRNKPIKLGQVGIRCLHCARLPVARRQKGSTYFPASLHGLYQAAQNMNTTHMQRGLCTEMPPEYKQMFAEAVNNKVSSSVAGRPYWAKTARQLGLIDTDDGIRFIRDLTPAQIAQIKNSQSQALAQKRDSSSAGDRTTGGPPGGGQRFG